MDSILNSVALWSYYRNSLLRYKYVHNYDDCRSAYSMLHYGMLVAMLAASMDRRYWKLSHPLSG